MHRFSSRLATSTHAKQLPGSDTPFDYKTNLLPSYGRDQIERSMQESGYHQQYRLYLQAVARWLRRVHGRDFPFLDRCGGVYYLYVRDLNGHDESTGVFYHRPTAQDLRLPPGT